MTDPLPPASGPGETPILSAEQIEAVRVEARTNMKTMARFAIFDLADSHEVLRRLLAVAEAERDALRTERDALWMFYENVKDIADGAVVSRAAGAQGETDHG